MIANLKRKYPNNGTFNVRMGQQITEAAIDSNVPNGYGVYLIFEGYECSGELIYIGHAGTIRTDGSMKKQGIRKRLGMKQDGMNRNDFFKNEMEKKRQGISVAWFITFDDDVMKILPTFAEAEAIQEYYRLTCKLPELNKTL